MRLLLDTHALVWWDSGEGLSDTAVAVIMEADQVYISAVSAWEIAIKAALGRLSTSRSTAAAAAESGFEELPLRIEHAERLHELPDHHADPFNRMLIAQALCERLTIVTRDRLIRRYEVRTLEA